VAHVERPAQTVGRPFSKGISTELFDSMALRSGGSTGKVFMFAYTGRPEHLAEKTVTRDEFIEDFYAITGRRDIKFGPAIWISNYRSVLVSHPEFF
jgi:hypothetical protein